MVRTDAPLPAPFAVGARVRYSGTFRGRTGQCASVVESHDGHKGTGAVLDDSDDPLAAIAPEDVVRDETSDGWNVATFDDGLRIAIKPEHVRFWAALK